MIYAEKVIINTYNCILHNASVLKTVLCHMTSHELCSPCLEHTAQSARPHDLCKAKVPNPRLGDAVRGDILIAEVIELNLI